jgi:DNA primase
MELIALVEAYLDLEWRRSTQGNIFIRCPSPDHNDRSPSCHLSLDKKLFYCFSCGAKGSLSAALRWKRAPEQVVNLVAESPLSPFIGMEPVDSPTLDEVILFAYKHPPRPWLDAGFDPDVLAENDVGYDKLNDRITVGVRDVQGELIAIVGRQSGDVKNKYIVYKEELGEFKPRSYFPKVHNCLWRADKLISADRDPIVVTEGYKACLWLVQSGYLSAVALLGTQLSDKQLEVLHSLGRDVILFLDNDPPGRQAQKEAVIKMYRRGLNVSTATYQVAVRQPDDLSTDEALASIFKSKDIQWTF